MHESLVRNDKQRVDLGQGSHETRVQGISTSLYELDRGKLSSRHNDGRTLRYGNDRCKHITGAMKAWHDCVMIPKEYQIYNN